jgi:hypothetical protein
VCSGAPLLGGLFKPRNVMVILPIPRPGCFGRCGSVLAEGVVSLPIPRLVALPMCLLASWLLVHCSGLHWCTGASSSDGTVHTWLVASPHSLLCGTAWLTVSGHSLNHFVFSWVLQKKASQRVVDRVAVWNGWDRGWGCSMRLGASSGLVFGLGVQLISIACREGLCGLTHKDGVLCSCGHATLCSVYTHTYRVYKLCTLGIAWGCMHAALGAALVLEGSRCVTTSSLGGMQGNWLPYAHAVMCKLARCGLPAITDKDQALLHMQGGDARGDCSRVARKAAENFSGVDHHKGNHARAVRGLQV